MMTKIIEKKNIKGLLKEATKTKAVFAPFKKVENDVWMEPLSKDESKIDVALENLTLDYEDIVISPKAIFFPQSEEMFEFKDGKIKEPVESYGVFLFGIRPCDLKGILFADDFFKRDFEDKYYLSKIQDRFIVTIGCIQPPRPNACFCASAKTGPFAQSGYDLQFVDDGERYFVEIGSKKGDEFLKKHTVFFADAPADADHRIHQIKEKAEGAVQLKVDFQKALECMADDKFIPEENYKRVAERCIYCGACLYTCPTCTCFNVFDDACGQEGRRVRNWDGCIFQGYTREVSGHNPREKKWLRASRRYEHKLKYDYKKTGISGCVGCGRCLSSCPVNIGMSKFIQEITEKRRAM